MLVQSNFNARANNNSLISGNIANNSSFVSGNVTLGEIDEKTTKFGKSNFGLPKRM